MALVTTILLDAGDLCLRQLSQIPRGDLAALAAWVYTYGYPLAIPGPTDGLAHSCSKQK